MSTATYKFCGESFASSGQQTMSHLTYAQSTWHRGGGAIRLVSDADGRGDRPGVHVPEPEWQEHVTRPEIRRASHPPLAYFE